MKLEPNKSIKIIVSYSDCPQLKIGDTLSMEGPMIDHEHSTATCVTALLAIYPWVIASRFGIESEQLEWNNGYHVWCPEKLVKFDIVHESNDLT